MKNSSKIQKVSSVLSKAIWSVSLVLTLLVNVSDANAAPKTWNGGTSTDWATAANWTPSGVPANGDDVTIGNVNTNYWPALASNTTINSLTILGRSSTSNTRGGDLSITTGVTLTITGNLSMTGASGGSNFGNTRITCNGTASISVGGSLTTNNGGVSGEDPQLILNSGTLAITGNLAFSTNTTFTCGTSTVKFNASSGTQTLNDGTSDNFNTISKEGEGTLQLSSNIPIVGNLTVTAGTLNLGTFTANRTAAGGTLTVSGALQIGGASNFPTNFTTITLGGTVEYNMTGAQTIASTPTYYNLKLSGSGVKTMTSVKTIGNDFNISGSSTAEISFSVTHDVNISGTAVMTVLSPQTIGHDLNIGINSKAIQNTGTTLVTNGLRLNTVGQNSGTWGGTASGATNKNATYFGSVTTGIFSFATPLPVKLIAFNGTRAAASSQLNFVTATEINNDKFEIERSINGIDFIKVGEVKGSGNSTQLVNYTFTDHNLANYATVAIYYRMKQLDYNGDFEYSNTIKLSLNTSTVKTNAVVSPNPFTNQLQVVLPNTTAEHTTLSIMTLYGTQVMDLSPALENRGIISINTEALAAGVYMLYVNQDGVITNTKIIKK